MSRYTIRKIYDDTRKHRVIIFRRDDGTFGFMDEMYSEEPDEMGWMPRGRYSECICDSLEAAEKEARGRVDWLSNE